jgi:hypothetical protein
VKLRHVFGQTLKILSHHSPAYEYLSPRERFLLRPAKSFFKELFLGSTKISHNLQRMSEQNGVVKGLKDQECEKGAILRRPPVSYVPVIDKVQEQLNSKLSGKRYEKLSTPAGTLFNVGVWYSGTPEQFLLHVKQAMHAVKRAGLVDTYYSACEKHEKAHIEFDKAVSSIVKWEEKNKKEGQSQDYKAVLKELKKEQDAYLKAQTEAEAK